MACAAREVLGGPRAPVPLMVTLIGDAPRDRRCDEQL